MRKADRLPRPHRLFSTVSCALAIVACLGGHAAVAAPDEAADSLAKLLNDKGLLGSPATATTPAPSKQGDEPETGLLSRVNDRASELAVSALNFMGVRYRRGGTSAETGFDCSGFTRHVYEMSLGLVLPHRAEEQAKAPGFVAVKRDELQPGDLVFFNTMKRTFSHVGIYIGDNRFIHAPSHGKDVRTDDLSFAYWAKRFTGARRAEPMGPPAPEAVKVEVKASAAEPVADRSIH